jgi:hypothetical protein
MSTVNSIADTLNANYKQVYGDDIEQLIPDGVKLMKDIDFVSAEKQQGGTYNQPVALKLEHGFSFGTGDEVLNLNGAVAGKIENATVTGYQVVGRAQIGWTAASRATNSKAAFKDATQVVLQNLMFSAKKKSEALLWYGQDGLGTVTSVSGSDVRLTDATCAEGLWAGAEGMPVDVYTSAGVLRQQCTITGVTFANSTPFITLTVDQVGAIASNDVIFFRGAYGREMLGAHKILTSTGTTQFGISQSTYPVLWTGTQYAPSSGQLTYEKLVKAAAIALPRGGEGKYKVYCHPQSWQDVVNNMESARDFSGYRPSILERGVESIKFHSVAGVMELFASTYCKRGFAYGFLQDKSWKRVGSTDVTLKAPGIKGQEAAVFYPLENTAAFEVRAYADFAAFCDKPAGSFVISNITQSA